MADVTCVACGYVRTFKAKMAEKNGCPQCAHAGIGSRSLCYQFPLRKNYLAQVIAPVDMTLEEAKRLCAFVQSLTKPDEK